MLAQDVIIDLAEYSKNNTAFMSDEVEQEIKNLLRTRAPDLSAKNSFRIAENLIDTAVNTIVALRGRIAMLEMERDKYKIQEGEWEGLLQRWRDMAVGLKDHVRDLEGKLAQADQRILQAELRAQNAEEDIIASHHGSYDLCDKVIAAFGAGTSLIDRIGAVAGEAAGNC